MADTSSSTPVAAVKSLMAGSSDDCDNDPSSSYQPVPAAAGSDGISSSNKNNLDVFDDDDKEQAVDVEKKKDDDTDTDTTNHHQHHHSKWLWLHAAYHCLVTIVGTGILGFPYATSYLGWVGATILITGVTAGAYYTSLLLTFLQKPDQGTYSELANGAMDNQRFANMWVRPFQYLNFFPTASVMILIGGSAMSTMDIMNNGPDAELLNSKSWAAVMGGIVMTLSLLPDLHSVWQVSLFGSIAVFLITFYCVAGSSMAIANNNANDTPPDYGRPDTNPDFAFGVMTSFGDILFGYGFHTILPDIQASLHETNAKEVHLDTKKAVTAAFSYSYPAYLIAALLGYAAFGSTVQSDILLDITYVLDPSAMYVVWGFVVVKTATEATVYNQAAFTLLRDSFGLTDKADHFDHHPKNRSIDILCRFIWVALATVVAIFVPYFSDLTAITAAVSVTPLSFVLPIVFWNRVNGSTAPLWRLIFHYVFAASMTLMGIAALVGAIYDIRANVLKG